MGHWFSQCLSGEDGDDDHQPLCDDLAMARVSNTSQGMVNLAHDSSESCSSCHAALPMTPIATLSMVRVYIGSLRHDNLNFMTSNEATRFDSTSVEATSRSDSISDETTGSDLTFDETTRNDSTSHEASGYDSAHDSATEHDSATDEATTGSHSTSHEVIGHDSASDEATGNDSDPDEATGHDSATDEATRYDLASDQTTRYDSASDEATRYDSASDEATRYDSASDEATGYDSASDEATGHDSASDEATGYESASDEATTYDLTSGYNPTSAKATRNDITTQSCASKMNLSCFTLHEVLGEGGIGRVVLATHKKNKKNVAIKTVIKRASNYNSIKTERYALEKAVGCPFLTQLYGTFQTRHFSSFVMEFVYGGDLGDFISCFSPLNSDIIRFIVAEISCGFDHLHFHGILHRDIKPDNILVNSAGHVRIADYGMAVAGLCENFATGVAGTLGFMAPEVINNDSYQFGPDWFSLGVVTYMMATQFLPFKNRDFDEYRREVNFFKPVYPPDMDPDLEDFIKGLLCKYPDERLGVCEDIRCHPFMENINWLELQKGIALPPFPVYTTPMDMEIDSRLPPSAVQPELYQFPEEEINMENFTYVNSM